MDNVLIPLLDRFSPNAPRSKRSRIQPTGSFSIESFLHSSSRYLYANKSLPSFVQKSCISIFILSNGFVTHLTTAEAFAIAEAGAFANATVPDGRFVPSAVL